MSKEVEFYFNTGVDTFKKIKEESENSIDEAATLMSEVILDGKLVHIIGLGGHSNMAAMELLWRAGG